MSNLSDYDLKKELIRCRTCDYSYHGACIKIDPSKVTFKEIKTGPKEPSFFEIFFECDFCQNPSKDLCAICENPKFLNASLLDEDTGEKLPCHLICALFSQRFKILDFEKFIFQKEKNAEVMELVSNCEFCKKEINMGGTSCKEKGCNKSAHLRCAVNHRSSYLTSRRDEVLDFTA